MKLKSSITKQLSIASGALSFIVFLMVGWGDIWGFGPVAKQIAMSLSIVQSGISFYFLGSTHNKIITEAQNEVAKK
jgi:hypothetical protein